ncbi:MAG: co-chaperone GroES [Vicingaceae bacterium]|jgi:chaperonin GroES|tara:strand:+ start:2723 stop:3004 length:282 start_codon:yes stop_codon:yes gene_type:complete
MEKTRLKPIGNRVLIKEDAVLEKRNGIIIPDTAKEKQEKGTVLAVGKGTKDEPMTLKVGDKVLYGKYSGTEIKEDGEVLLIVRESDVFAVIHY